MGDMAQICRETIADVHHGRGPITEPDTLLEAWLYMEVAPKSTAAKGSRRKEDVTVPGPRSQQGGVTRNGAHAEHVQLQAGPFCNVSTYDCQPAGCRQGAHPVIQGINRGHGSAASRYDVDQCPAGFSPHRGNIAQYATESLVANGFGGDFRCKMYALYHGIGCQDEVLGSSAAGADHGTVVARAHHDILSTGERSCYAFDCTQFAYITQGLHLTLNPLPLVVRPGPLTLRHRCPAPCFHVDQPR